MGSLLVGVVRRSGGNTADFGPVKFREEVRRSKRETALDCLSQKDLLSVRWDKAVSSAPILRIRPTMDPRDRSPGHLRDGLIATADLDDFLCRFHHGA